MFQMSLNASVLIIFVILIRAIAINYFPKKTFIALWGIVLARLIIPISIPLDFSLFKFMDIATDTKSLFLKNASDFIVPIINNELLHENSIANINASMNVSQLLITFWVLGIAISLIIFLVSYIRCYKNMMEALPINDNEFIREWTVKQNMKRKVVILISDRITTPITFGVITPKIVFPKTMDCSNHKQMDYVLSHELVHIKRLIMFGNLLL